MARARLWADYCLTLEQSRRGISISKARAEVLGDSANVCRYKKQATELGKASFALAWVMDTGSEERERGVTVDIAQHHFSTSLIDFTILDAPGHRDFVPNMIGGASMADLAVLVVDANQLESGMKGQTREHILLAHAVGIQRIVVAVNKLDSTMPAWSEDVFNTVSTEVRKLLAHTGFREENIAIVPCSGLNGDNVAKPPSDTSATSWVTKNHRTLLSQLERFAPSTTTAERLRRPLRMQIADVFRGGITNPLSIAGRLATGAVQPGDSLLVQPSGESATVKALDVSSQPRDYTVAGEIPTLHLVDIEPQHLRGGDVVCSPQHPIHVLKQFEVNVSALESLLPQRVDVHLGRLHVAGAIAQLVATVDGKGEVLRKRPRMVKEGQRAVVKLILDEGVPVDEGDCVVLRVEGRTVGFGAVRTRV